LELDKFFHDKISESKEGWLDIDHILNCKKIKTLSTDKNVILDSVEDSKEVEINTAKTQIRRIENKPLPELQARVTRKRDQKEQEKKDEDAKGELNERHFKNPKILTFKIEDAEKPNWRDLEHDITAAFPDFRILYSRADEEKTGHLAICNIGLNEEKVEEFLKKGVVSKEKHFSFAVCDKEELNKFWADHGTHYQMCSG